MKSSRRICLLILCLFPALPSFAQKKPSEPVYRAVIRGHFLDSSGGIARIVVIDSATYHTEDKYVIRGCKLCCYDSSGLKSIVCTFFANDTIYNDQIHKMVDKLPKGKYRLIFEEIYYNLKHSKTVEGAQIKRLPDIKIGSYTQD